jgi:hypothetical protein
MNALSKSELVVKTVGGKTGGGAIDGRRFECDQTNRIVSIWWIKY